MRDAMRVGLSRWWSAVVLVAFSAFVWPQAATAQGTPPLKATIFLKNPPPGNPPGFSATTPVPIVLQLENVSGSLVFTTEKFSSTEFFRQLNFSVPGGGTLSDPAAIIHKTAEVKFCFSRTINGGTINEVKLFQQPALPVVPIEILAAGPPSPPGFFLEYQIPDARTYYNDLVQPGLYTVNARIPILTFGGTPITDCDQFPGTQLVNVGVGGGGTEFTIISNGLQFRICCFIFDGFREPVGLAAPAGVDPCVTGVPSFTTNWGNTIPLKFGLSDASGPVSTAVATVSAQTCSGQLIPGDLGQGSVPTNQFKLSGDQYVFNLATNALGPPAVYRIDVAPGDGSLHSVLIGPK